MRRNDISTHKHDDHVRSAFCAHIVDPLGRLVERVGVGDIIDHNSHRRVPYVGGDEAAEPLLSRRVPQLQPHRPVLQVHGLGQEVDADRSLVSIVEGVVHEPRDERGLAHRLLAEEDQLELPEWVVKRVARRGHDELEI